MSKKELDSNSQGIEDDWEGNNAAFTCPVDDCGKVYIVSSLLHKSGRKCPKCGKSTAYATGSKMKGGIANIEW